MAIWFEPKTLVDSLSETAGYKTGLALSLDDLCDHLADSGNDEVLRQSEMTMVRLRPEDYEAIFYTLLHRLGYTDEEYDGDHTGIGLFHKYRDTELEEINQKVAVLLVSFWPKLVAETKKSGGNKIDPTPYLEECHRQFGMVGAELAFERINVITRAINLSPYSGLRYKEWKNTERLEYLFSGGGSEPEDGKYIDQRFINYLNANPNKLGELHWRKFEELTAEYFDRNGFK